MSLSDEISENKTRVISMYRWNCAAAENLFIGSMETERGRKNERQQHTAESFISIECYQN